MLTEIFIAIKYLFYYFSVISPVIGAFENEIQKLNLHNVKIQILLIAIIS